MSPKQARWAVIGLVFAGALVVYARGAAPSILYADSAELQAVGFLGGIAHPTGYPTFILMGRLFGALGWGEPAYRITFMGAFFAAAALALVVLLLHELQLSLRGAVAGALIYGTSFSFWCSALRAEVYPLAICIFLLALWRTIIALRHGGVLDACGAGVLIGLSLTGHLYFLLPAAALGLTLAWRVARSAARPPLALTLLLGCFLLGLTPYLYLVWADGQSYAMNYLRLVDLAAWPTGPRPAHLDTSWERVAWLIRGGGHVQAPLWVHPRLLLINVAFAGAIVFLFELGPVSLPLAISGIHRHWRRESGLVWLIGAIVGLSGLFSVLFAAQHMLFIFLMPCVLATTLWVAEGWEALFARLPRRLATARLSSVGWCLLAPLAITMPAHAIRMATYDRPLGPWSFRVREEDGHRAGFIPSYRDFREPRRFGEAALVAIPSDALVVGRFRDQMVLYYLRYVEGHRPDLTFQPMSYPPLLARLDQWQRRHSLEERPIVFLERLPMMEPHLSTLDSVQATPGRWIYVARTPLHHLGGVPRPEP